MSQRKWLVPVVALFSVVAMAAIAAGLYRFFHRISIAVAPTSGILGASSYTASIADDAKSIAITKDGVSLKAITLGEIPSFDADDSGKPANPVEDYLFGPTVAIDQSRAVLYLSAYNLSTGGNANADRALFSYDIGTGKLALLKNESYTVSFGDIELSPDGRFLVYSEGTDAGGICYESMGLEIYDLKNQTDTDSIFLGASAVGDVEFDRWTGDAVFAYKEDTYPTLAACRQDAEGNPRVVEKDYTIAATSDRP